MQLVHLYNMLANRNVGILLALRSGGCFLVVFATPNRNLQVWFLLLMIGLGLWFGVVGRLVLVFWAVVGACAVASAGVEAVLAAGAVAWVRGSHLVFFPRGNGV